MTAPTILVDGELTIPLVGQTLVASASTPNAWHVVTHNACDCPSFTFRGTCRHLGLATEAQRMARILTACLHPAVLTTDAAPEWRHKRIGDMSPDEYGECLHWLTDNQQPSAARQAPPSRTFATSRWSPR